MTETTPDQLSAGPKSPLNSSWALAAGVAFCVGYTALIYFLKPYMPQIDFAPDTGASHYLWKLPDPTFWSRATAWAGYILSSDDLGDDLLRPKQQAVLHQGPSPH